MKFVRSWKGALTLSLPIGIMLGLAAYFDTDRSAIYGIIGGLALAIGATVLMISEHDDFRVSATTDAESTAQTIKTRDHVLSLGHALIVVGAWYAAGALLSAAS